MKLFKYERIVNGESDREMNIIIPIPTLIIFLFIIGCIIGAIII